MMNLTRTTATRVIAGIVAAIAVLATTAVAQQVDLKKAAKLRSPATFTEKAPATYTVNFDTSKGPFVVTVHKDWAPIGADRFYNLVKNGFYDDVRFFRAMAGFMVQFGMHGNPAVTAAWKSQTMKDDTRKQSNKRGYVTFASTQMPNSRTTQVFINLVNNPQLDSLGFTPFGEVTTGMDVVGKITTQYGDNVDQDLITRQGNAYLTKEFPKLDYIKTATLGK